VTYNLLRSLSSLLDARRHFKASDAKKELLLLISDPLLLKVGVQRAD